MTTACARIITSRLHGTRVCKLVITCKCAHMRARANTASDLNTKQCHSPYPFSTLRSSWGWLTCQNGGMQAITFVQNQAATCWIDPYQGMDCCRAWRKGGQMRGNQVMMSWTDSESSLNRPRLSSRGGQQGSAKVANNNI